LPKDFTATNTFPACLIVDFLREGAGCSSYRKKYYYVLNNTHNFY
jgi:hypothetical protein